MPASPTNDRRSALRQIAEATLEAIGHGSYVLNGVNNDLEAKVGDSKRKTKFYAPDSFLSTWTLTPTSSPTSTDKTASTQISILEISTLDAARYLSNKGPGKLGILNFASAKKPGGGFLTGAQAQEESIARSSALYPTLMTSTARNFYTLHNKDAKGGFYSHAMVYSPGVVVFRDDGGGWQEPFTIDVLTSPAVNAGVIRKSPWAKSNEKGTEEKIVKTMKERMGRILFLFEREGAKRIVLGSFGTGVFQNNVDVVARLWAELLAVPGSRFETSFDEVVFGILGRKTFEAFGDGFRVRG